MTGPPNPAQAGDADSAAERERLLAEVLAHAEQADRVYAGAPAPPRPRSGWKAAAAVALLALAVYFALVPPPALSRSALPPPSPAAVRAGLGRELLLQAYQVEAFRLRQGRLPRDLDEAGNALPGVRYVRSGNRGYQLVALRPDGGSLVFDSARPGAGFDTFLLHLWTSGDRR